jgi:hypothetical protein
VKADRTPKWQKDVNVVRSVSRGLPNGARTFHVDVDCQSHEEKRRVLV